jgi:hypothetical protein
MERYSVLNTMTSVDDVHALLLDIYDWNSYMQNAYEKARDENDRANKRSRSYASVAERDIPDFAKVLWRDTQRWLDNLLVAGPNGNAIARYNRKSMCADVLNFSWHGFKDLCRQFCLSEQPTPVEFEKNLVFCTDWHKMDEDGVPFGGFYKFPEGSYERENAFRLQFEANKKAILSLPFPYLLIKWTVDHGCSYRCESVKFSRTACQWVDARIKESGPALLTLAETIRYQLNCRHEPWPEA